MKLNDFISEYYEMIDDPNEVLEFFKLASDYLSPATYNELCKMLREANINFDWQAIINQTNYIADYKEIPSDIDDSIKLDEFINKIFKSELISTNISQLNITFNELNDLLHKQRFSTTADIDGEIESPKAIVDNFNIVFMLDSQFNVVLYIFFVDKQKNNYLDIYIPVLNEELDMGQDIVWLIPHQVLLYNENNIKKLINKYNIRVNDLVKEVIKRK